MTSKNILIAILFLAVFATGFMIGRITAPGGMASTQQVSPATTQSTTDTSAQADTSVPAENTEAINVGSQMTADQRKMLESFGLNPDEVTITPEMIACAEAKVGAARIQEIINGATPSFMEGASLITCYGQ